MSAYAMWNCTRDAELGAYRTADRLFSVIRADADPNTQLNGTAPHWCLARQHEWDNGTQSAMVGTFGLKTSKFPDPTDLSTPVDQFLDTNKWVRLK